MSISLAKLQQLKHQSGQPGGARVPTGPSAVGTVAALPPSLSIARAHPLVYEASGDPEASLERLRTLLRVRTPRTVRGGTHHDRDVPGDEIAPGVRLVERMQRCEPVPEWLDGAFDRKGALRSRDLLFFDTETTGLAGGTGTRAFMIGASDWADGGLRVRQLYLTTMAGESAMLDAFAGWLRPTTTLVSYNGKCYDAPLLATRYRLARKVNPLMGLAHVDLLFPSRRRWRGTWENCRLATIEREVLRVVREDDLPGAEAPAAWLEYLRGGAADKLRRVAKHNHQDVVSLARLIEVLAAGHPDIRD
ncbi:hypothetical protein N800_08825 [Lysobacter daejeonensis GH1-9]|uniref:YprB ribonuclease H-like domain-containing protein n=1 Tax=Lysobacter daejeonensis GH1-9 TaxID=1385517 RepID=A0A0A0EZB9_9GAMM|nr:ribonuclease H-like domain-containing protein [Lysobacter daejeonensis]KGM56291.1 hypothetical protein N800_08825 [Lysobacter daejeonensis GH1-9]